MPASNWRPSHTEPARPCPALIRNIGGSIDRQVSLTDAVEATPEFRDFVDHLATLINIQQPRASSFTDAIGQKRQRDAAKNI
ncbi:hypothetical protein DIPPA_32478 [Diplonema papillatum]|nr:hypothetical protein DIPPA_32478 [Diplonema papillatum]